MVLSVTQHAMTRFSVTSAGGGAGDTCPHRMMKRGKYQKEQEDREREKGSREKGNWKEGCCAPSHTRPSLLISGPVNVYFRIYRVRPMPLLSLPLPHDTGDPPPLNNCTNTPLHCFSRKIENQIGGNNQWFFSPYTMAFLKAQPQVCLLGPLLDRCRAVIREEINVFNFLFKFKHCVVGVFLWASF